MRGLSSPLGREETNVPATEVADNSYRSPLMSRLSGHGKLTLVLLREQVPVFQAGKAAEVRLAEADVASRERSELLRAVAAGERAKERLVLAAIPLIKHLAQREHVRRQNWNSQVTFEDLFQEGTGGLLRGLSAYKADGNHKSPTNYLGQWILIEMRRNVEQIDNDFGVAFDAAERFRRIRALRSRLSAHLGREPTDEEIILASEDGSFTGGSKLGRVKAVGAAPATGKRITVAQIAEERNLRYRVGYTARLTMSGGSDELEGPLVDFAKPLDTETVGDSAEQVVERGAREGLSRILDATLVAMGLPAMQREVISRRYGLAPHEKEESARDISRLLDLHRERVGRVVEAFSAEMSRPGGAFHRVCSDLDADELADLGLLWVVRTLGDYAAVSARKRNASLPDALTAPLTRRVHSAVAPPEEPVTVSGRPAQVRAQFMCSYHAWGFVGTYKARADVPPTRSCPQCSQPSRLIRIMET